MPIDTPAKRASMLSFGDEALLPIPDAAAETAADRLHLLGLYSGIAAAAAVAAAVVRAIGKVSRKKTRRPAPFMLPTGLPAAAKAERATVAQSRMRAEAQAIVDAKPAPQFHTFQPAPPAAEAPAIAPTMDSANKQAADVAGRATLQSNARQVAQAISDALTRRYGEPTNSATQDVLDKIRQPATPEVDDAQEEGQQEG